MTELVGEDPQQDAVVVHHLWTRMEEDEVRPLRQAHLIEIRKQPQKDKQERS